MVSDQDISVNASRSCDFVLHTTVQVSTVQLFKYKNQQQRFDLETDFEANKSRIDPQTIHFVNTGFRFYCNHPQQIVNLISKHNSHTRFNTHGWDLNRNFPDYFEDNLRHIHRAKEVQAVMQWGNQLQFVISGAWNSAALWLAIVFSFCHVLHQKMRWSQWEREAEGQA